MRDRKGGRRIIAATAYTAPYARVLDPLCDLLVVDCDVAMQIHGLPSPASADLAMMVLHAHAVARGAPASKIVVELPHASWTHSLDLAYETSIHILREVECCGVLLPLETVAIETIRHLASCKVPVIARADIAMPEEAGLGAQFTAAEREWHAIQVVNDARAVAEAGAFAILAVGQNDKLALALSRAVPVPVIGAESGSLCDGLLLRDVECLSLLRSARENATRSTVPAGSATARKPTPRPAPNRPAHRAPAATVESIAPAIRRDAPAPAAAPSSARAAPKPVSPPTVAAPIFEPMPEARWEAADEPEAAEETVSLRKSPSVEPAGRPDLVTLPEAHWDALTDSAVGTAPAPSEPVEPPASGTGIADDFLSMFGIAEPEEFVSRPPRPTAMPGRRSEAAPDDNAPVPAAKPGPAPASDTSAPTPRRPLAMRERAVVPPPPPASAPPAHRPPPARLPGSAARASEENAGRSSREPDPAPAPAPDPERTTAKILHLPTFSGQRRRRWLGPPTSGPGVLSLLVGICLAGGLVAALLLPERSTVPLSSAANAATVETPVVTSRIRTEAIASSEPSATSGFRSWAGTAGPRPVEVKVLQTRPIF
ncbi:3-methyl-2-oxobutanoate hydroxymethyltransferase [Prosthecodimorpha staleyi]|uniref:3-methyl-2-oxobutanoate hydroxymethyltransferase n=1 Tax=Prosthecodimorpha staleyi TaxID=2840188 RepID=A0A947D5K2_9HYPH|nr:3-methyl-2-oxobutanoate hydroxymethyltransferase [Prosthecodimorpha staleyi]MBT9290738.1 3-methyl-2-oxobutanoate hydroxymethyltransferase [Prosthecodimorpha staleyi]